MMKLAFFGPRNLSLILAMGLLSSCATVKKRLDVVSSLPTSPLRVVELSSVQLTEPARMGDRSVNEDISNGAWQWRGRNALGAPPQSFVAPQFLGGNDILISTLGGGIGVYDLKSGAAKWMLPIPVGVASKPLVRGSYVFVAGMDGYVRKIRLDNGAQEWSSRISAESLGGVASFQSFIYVSTGDDSIWALDEKTGISKWTYKRPSPQANVYWSLRGNSIPMLSPDGLRLYAGFSDGVFVALESISGQTVWERNFDRSGRFKDADQPFELSHDGTQIFVPLVDGDLIVLKASDGASLWSVPGGGASTPMIDEEEGSLYTAAVDGSLLKVDLKDAKILWSTPIEKAFYSQPVAIDRDYIVLTSAAEGLIFIDRRDGKIVDRFRLGRSHLATPAFDGSRLLMLSARNRFYVFKVQRRSLTQSAPTAKAGI